MKPINLYKSQKEYYNSYLLLVFQKHINQEEWRRKYLAYLKWEEPEEATSITLEAADIEPGSLWLIALMAC